MNLVYEIWLDAGMRTDVIASESLNLKKNDNVIVDFGLYQDFGRVIFCRGELPQEADPESMPNVLRRATLQDQSRAHDNYLFQKSSRRKVEAIVDSSKLGIEVVDLHISYDCKKMTLKFISQRRVDFRSLVRDLARQMDMRVELRQIGVRDVAKMNGGIGTCGRVLCCTSWIHEFFSLNVKMAKDQGLPHNNNIISGQCGRLKCCLAFEHQGYKMIAEEMPLPGSRCFVEGQEGRVLDLNLLRRSALVRLKQDGRIVQVLRDQLDDFQINEKGCGNAGCSSGKEEASAGGSCTTCG